MNLVVLIMRVSLGSQYNANWNIQYLFSISIMFLIESTDVLSISSNIIIVFIVHSYYVPNEMYMNE